MTPITKDDLIMFSIADMKEMILLMQAEIKRRKKAFKKLK